MTATVVIGAGISGLTYAHARAGADLLVLEAAPRAGGLVRTALRDGFRYEEGPEALPGGARGARELCQTLGVALHEAPPAAAKRFLLLDGKLLEVPASPADLATSRILSFGGKLRLMAEASCAAREALEGSIADFARHRFGKEALERVVDPLVAGIHAGDPELLSLRACFPEVVHMVEQHGSITAAFKARAQAKKPGAQAAPLGGNLWKPAGGNEELPRALARALGARLALASPVQALERNGAGFRVELASGERHTAERVVLAVALDPARRLLADVAPAAAETLGDMQAESLVSVVHAYRREDVGHALDGFGYLVPKSAGGLVLGTLFSSTIDPSTAPAGHVLLRSLLGGARHPEAAALGDEELLARLHRECVGPLDLRRAPHLAVVARYPAVIPRLDLRHVARRAELARALPSGLAVLGNFTRGLGLGTLIDEARALARA